MYNYLISVFQNDHNSNPELFFSVVNHLIFLLCFIIVDILRHLNLYIYAKYNFQCFDLQNVVKNYIVFLILHT